MALKIAGVSTLLVVIFAGGFISSAKTLIKFDLQSLPSVSRLRLPATMTATILFYGKTRVTAIIN